MTTEELLKKTKELIAIPSTDANPEAVQAAYDFMIEFVQTRAPWVTIEEFELDGKMSFLAYKSKKRPEKFDILLNGHLDVVAAQPVQFVATVKDGKLYGRGAFDMKAACIIMAEVFCEFVDKVPYNLALQLVTDEEGADKGVRYQVEDKGVRADFAICGECGRSTTRYEIANEAKGATFINVEFTGKVAHGAYPWRGDNAAVKAAKFAHTLHALYPAPEEEHPETTVTISGIDSDGDAPNRVPGHAVVRLDARFGTDDPHFQSTKTATAFIKEIAPDAKISFSLFTRPMYSNPNVEYLQGLKKAAEAVEGHTFSFARRNGGSDASHFIDAGGQACEFGIAGEDQHGDHEHVTLQAFEHYLETLRVFLQHPKVQSSSRPLVAETVDSLS